MLIEETPVTQPTRMQEMLNSRVRQSQQQAGHFLSNKRPVVPLCSPVSGDFFGELFLRG